MDRITRLQQMFEYAKEKCICRTKQEFSKHIGIANSNLSHAFNGDTRYLNDNLLKRINESLDNAFSLEWLMYGTGEMYAQSNNVQAHVPTPMPAREETPTDKYLENLEYTISVQKETIELQRYRILQLEKECENLKKELATISRATTA